VSSIGIIFQILSYHPTSLTQASQNGSVTTISPSLQNCNIVVSLYLPTVLPTQVTLAF